MGSVRLGVRIWGILPHHQDLLQKSPCVKENLLQGRRHDARLQANCSPAVESCKTRGATNLRISFDDTVFYPSYAILSEVGKRFYVGGAEQTKIEVSKKAFVKLKKNNLAQVCISYLAARSMGCETHPKEADFRDGLAEPPASGRGMGSNDSGQWQ